MLVGPLSINSHNSFPSDSHKKAPMSVDIGAKFIAIMELFPYAPYGYTGFHVDKGNVQSSLRILGEGEG